MDLLITSYFPVHHYVISHQSNIFIRNLSSGTFYVLPTNDDNDENDDSGLC